MAGLRKYWMTSRPTLEDTTRCIAVIYAGRAGLQSHQCPNKRGYGKDGLYCKIHNPDAIQVRRDKEHARWIVEAEADRQKSERKNACLKAFSGITLQQIQERLQNKQCPCCGRTI